MTTPKMAGMTPGTFTFSPALLGQSPAAAHHLLNKHRSPAPMQAGFNTPEALAAMGLDMTPGASGAGHLGIPQISMGMAIPPDENKKRELGEILRLLTLRPGRISEEGVERLAKRMGLECYKDSIAGLGITTMSLGAKIFLLDIDFRDSTVTRVALTFGQTAGPSQELAHLADTILHRNLCPTLKNPSEHPPLIAPSLSSFADNLDRLAKTDRLSSPPQLNCFTAITGIYTSLSKIFDHESSTLDGGVAAAMCKGTGRPRMHVRSKVGLSVEYWQERRYITLPSSSPTTPLEDEDEEAATYRVLIEVEEAPSDFSNLNSITPVRTSSHWVSDEIKKPNDDNLFGDPEDTVTDWLEPPLEEFLEAPVSSRFVARLDPPVAIPFADELHLFSSLMLSPPVGVGAGTIEALLFPKGGTERERRLFVPLAADDVLGEAEEEARHKYRLHSGLKPIYARHVHEVPFSHPKELVGIFQILRQFAFVGTLLKSCFDPLSGSMPEKDTTVDSNNDDSDDDLDAFMADLDNGSSEELTGVLPVDVALGSDQQGGFTVGVIFPFRGGITSFGVEVGRNADVRVVDTESKGEVDVRELERAVVVGEDLGVAVEWVRRR